MKIGEDKKGHFKAGMVITFIASIIIMALDMFFGESFGIAIEHAQYGAIMAWVAGIGKEAKDYYDNVVAEKKGLRKPHSVEFMDFWFTVLGGMIIATLFGIF